MDGPLKPIELCPFCGSSDVDYLLSFEETIDARNGVATESTKKGGFKVIEGEFSKKKQEQKGSLIKTSRENRFVCHDCGRSFNEDQKTVINGYRVIISEDFSHEYRKLTRKYDLIDFFKLLRNVLDKFKVSDSLSGNGLVSQEKLHIKIDRRKYTVLMNIYIEQQGTTIHAMKRMWEGWY